MKKLYKIFLVLIFLIPVLKAQETTPAVELFFMTENIPLNSPIMTFTLTAQSQVWGWGNITIGICNPPYGSYSLTNDYDISVYVPEENNWGNSSEGFDFVSAQDGFSVFAYGIYKVTSNGTNKYFYLDYRDYRAGYYDCYDPEPIGNAIDIRIKYDYDFDTFSYSPTNSNYQNIINGQLLNIWEMKGMGAGTQLTSRFPNYWENCLAGINNSLNHPKLVWGKYPNPGSLPGTITGYKVYRATNHIPGQPPGSFSLLETVGTNDFEYVDNSATIGNDFYANSYYVTCIYEDIHESVGETSATNTVEIILAPLSKQSAEGYSSNNSIDFDLQQNFPNPFNPATIISFSIAENSFITLEVYDILGIKVAGLINGTKQAGTYSVSFDASKLSSGVYFYTLSAIPIGRAGAGGVTDYSFTKKMILTK